MSFYVFDLDGTLADLTHRLSYIESDPKDWRGFFAACPGDKVIVPIRSILWSLADEGNRVEIWSGRSDEVRTLTETWLEENCIDPLHLTFMRKDGDHQNDDDLKLGFLRKSNARPDVVFDDRRRVVDMWRREGITCCHVADGEF